MGGETRRDAKRYKKIRAAYVSAQRITIHPGADLGAHKVVAEGPDSDTLAAMVAYLSDRNDGWLRIMPQVNGEVAWKYRFTHGAHAGRYVFIIQTIYQTAREAAQNLRASLADVDIGGRKPSLDTW